MNFHVAFSLLLLLGGIVSTIIFHDNIPTGKHAEKVTTISQVV